MRTYCMTPLRGCRQGPSGKFCSFCRSVALVRSCRVALVGSDLDQANEAVNSIGIGSVPLFGMFDNRTRIRAASARKPLLFLAQ
jgi:hypothetical protein